MQKTDIKPQKSRNTESNHTGFSVTGIVSSVFIGQDKNSNDFISFQVIYGNNGQYKRHCIAFGKFAKKILEDNIQDGDRVYAWGKQTLKHTFAGKTDGSKITLHKIDVMRVKKLQNPN